MKIPKKLIITGRVWRVIKERKERGGWFYSDKNEIHVGLKDYTPSEIEHVFMHEVLEAILANELYRYKLPYTGDDNGNYMFMFDHKGLERISRDLCLALKGIK